MLFVGLKNKFYFKYIDLEGLVEKVQIKSI